MLDLVPFEETAAAKAKARGGDIWVTHRNIEDVSLYEKYGKIRRVPIEAMTSTPDLTPTGEVIREIVEPQRMDDYHALQNTATGGFSTSGLSANCMRLIPHDGLFKAQAQQLAASDLPLDNVEVVDRIYEEGARVHRTIYFHDLQDLSTTRDRQSGPGALSDGHVQQRRHVLGLANLLGCLS